jgi:hemoglobin
MIIKHLQRIAGLALLSFSALALAQADDSTYQGLGGKDGIKNIVRVFIPLIKSDERIKSFFSDTDMGKLAQRLGEQFCQLSGGPCQYKGKDMADIHDGLNITVAQFNALTEDLQMAMERNGVPMRIQNQLVAKLAPLQRSIVAK